MNAAQREALRGSDQERRVPERVAGEETLGVDLGGTKVSAVVLGPDGKVLTSAYRPHDGTGGGAQSALLDVVAETLQQTPTVNAVGIAAAGLVDRERGVLVHSALLDIHDLPIGKTVSVASGLDVLVENDANATLAGIQAEEPAGVNVLVALGTGVGGAISVNGHLVNGSFGFAAELGHIPIEAPALHPCPCGSSGCVELFASGTAVARRAASAGMSVGTGLPPRAEDVVAAAQNGDTLAVQILESAGRAVGSILSTLWPVLDPAVVYISGGFGHASAEFLIPAARERLRQQLPFAHSRPDPLILRDPVGPLAAAIGAARLVRSHITSSH